MPKDQSTSNATGPSETEMTWTEPPPGTVFYAGQPGSTYPYRAYHHDTLGWLGEIIISQYGKVTGNEWVPVLDPTISVQTSLPDTNAPQLEFVPSTPIDHPQSSNGSEYHQEFSDARSLVVPITQYGARENNALRKVPSGNMSIFWVQAPSQAGSSSDTETQGGK